MKVSFLSVPVPIDKTDPSFEDSAKQFLEAEMPNVVKALKKGAVTAAQKTKRQEFVQSVLSNARGEMLSRLPDGSSVHEQVLSPKAINVQFVVTIETPYGKIKHRAGIKKIPDVQIPSVLGNSTFPRTFSSPDKWTPLGHRRFARYVEETPNSKPQDVQIFLLQATT